VGVAGRRRLVAQPGGLTLAFALPLVVIVTVTDTFFGIVSDVVTALDSQTWGSARCKMWGKPSCFLSFPFPAALQ